MTLKIAIIGNNGQLAWDLRNQLSSLGSVVTFHRHSTDNYIDLSNLTTIKTALENFLPNIIINASAYTAVDKAEEEKELAKKINADAPYVLSELSNSLNALLIHYSTDYVFNGESSSPYTELAKPDPLNVYGQTKLDGDLAVLSTAKNHFVFRTSWVYTNRANNFMLTMLKLAKQRDELNIINDQVGSPTWSRVIAETTANVIRSRYVLKEELEGGLYNLSSQGETSWYGFAKKIFEYAGICGDINVNPIATANYPTPAKRPKYTVLSKDKIESALSIKIPHWEESLKLCMSEYLRESSC